MLTESPFIRVEATKYTETGFKGKDVDSIISDLLDNSIKLTKENIIKEAKKEVVTNNLFFKDLFTKYSFETMTIQEEKIDERLLDALIGKDSSPENRRLFKQQLKQGLLNNRKITIEIPVRHISTTLATHFK